MKTTIYANYGVLAHEKEVVYTTAPTDYATVSEPITVEIPETFHPCENVIGQVLLTIDGSDYLLDEVLTNRGDDPCISWYDGQEFHFVCPRVIKE